MCLHVPPVEHGSDPMIMTSSGNQNFQEVVAFDFGTTPSLRYSTEPQHSPKIGTFNGIFRMSSPDESRRNCELLCNTTHQPATESSSSTARADESGAPTTSTITTSPYTQATLNSQHRARETLKRNHFAQRPMPTCNLEQLDPMFPSINSSLATDSTIPSTTPSVQTLHHTHVTMAPFSDAVASAEGLLELQ